MTKHLSLRQMARAGVVIPTIIYGRVSSAPQLHGEGLKRQSRGGLDWISQRTDLNLRVDAQLEDKARSAWKGDHATKGDAALASILKQVERGDLSPPLMLVMESLDRFSRENKWLATHRLSGIVAKGIFVATTKDNRIYTLDSDVGDLIVSVVLLSAAHEQSQTTSERVSKTKQIRVQETIEHGWVLHQRCPGWLRVTEKLNNSNRASRKYVLIEQHAATVLLIFQMALLHGSGYITRWLIAHQDEHPPFGRTGRWSIRTVKRVLRSRAPLGHIVSKHGVAENIYPRVPGLTDELWLQVQAAQDDRRDAGSRPATTGRVNLLAGIGECGLCGGKMRLTQAKPTDPRYYGCWNHAILHTCGNKARYRADVIEVAILDRFGLGWLEAKPRRKATNLPALEAAVTKLREREKRLASRLRELDGDEMFDVVMAQLRILRREVSDAATRLQAARQQAAVAEQSVKIEDTTDRAMIGSVLKHQLVSARFGKDHHVALITAAGYVLSVIAKVHAPEKKSAWLERAPKPEVAQYPN